MKSKLLKLLFLVSLIGGCVHNYDGAYITLKGVYIEPSSYEEIIVGEAKKDDIHKKLGQPKIESRLSADSNVLSYVVLRCRKSVEISLLSREEFYSSVENSYQFFLDEKNNLTKKETKVTSR